MTKRLIILAAVLLVVALAAWQIVAARSAESDAREALAAERETHRQIREQRETEQQLEAEKQAADKAAPWKKMFDSSK